MKILNIERASTNLHTANFYKFLEFLPSGFRILLDLRIFISALRFWLKISEFHTNFLSSTEELHLFSTQSPPLRNQKPFSSTNPSVQHILLFGVKLRDVLNWKVFNVELTLFWCWTEGCVELRSFCVELRDLGTEKRCSLCWTDVLNWGVLYSLSGKKLFRVFNSNSWLILELFDTSQNVSGCFLCYYLT